MLPEVGVFSCLTGVLGAGEWKGLGLSKVFPVRPALGGAGDAVGVEISFSHTTNHCLNIIRKKFMLYIPVQSTDSSPVL